MRTLESAADSDSGIVQPFAGETDIFIRPGYQFRVVDALITNFHLPESTLLMLVSAFSGYQRIKAAYDAAIKMRYRYKAAKGYGPTYPSNLSMILLPLAGKRIPHGAQPEQGFRHLKSIEILA